MTPDDLFSRIKYWAYSTSREKRVSLWPLWRDILISECPAIDRKWLPSDYCDLGVGYNSSALHLLLKHPDKLEKIYARFTLIRQ